MSEAMTSTGRESTPTASPLLRVRDLKTHFPIRKGVLSRVHANLRAVDGVSLDVATGETVGIVGESGCGKTTLGRTILRLTPATSGSIHFDGHDVLSMSSSTLRRVRRDMQIIFQDPAGSLNPRMTVASIVGEPLMIHRIATGRNMSERVAELLEKVGLTGDDLHRYPHEFSGGQRQRIGIARAIALNPKFIVCDEPVSALDVSIQSQVINLLADLRGEFGLSYLFIAHNLAVVRHFCDRIAVMYLGRIVESASAANIFASARHPYTMALLSAVPEPDPQRKRSRIVLRGEVPSAVDPPTGCAFHTRCPFATDICRSETPPLTGKTGLSDDHIVACHHADELLQFPASTDHVSASGGDTL